MHVIPEKKHVVCNKLMSTFHFLYIKDVVKDKFTMYVDCELVHASNF